MKLIKVHKENLERNHSDSTLCNNKVAQTAQKIIEEYSEVFEGDLETLEELQHLDVDP